MSLNVSLITDLSNNSTRLINNKFIPIVVLYNHKECIHIDFKLNVTGCLKFSKKECHVQTAYWNIEHELFCKEYNR